MKKIEGKIKIIGHAIATECKVFVITDDGDEVDVTGSVEAFRYTAIAGKASRCELTIFPNEFEGLANENLIVDVEEKPQDGSG